MSGEIVAIHLTWEEAIGVDSYIVSRSVITGGPYWPIGMSTVPNFTDVNVQTHVRYYYVVSAVKNNSVSQHSTEISQEVAIESI